MKPVFLTFIYGDDTYYKIGSKLLNKFKDQGYQTFVYTEKLDSFNGHTVIPYTEKKFSYHHKIFAVEHLFKLGYKEILYIDSDLLILEDKFFSDLLELKPLKGISVSRNGVPSDFDSYLSDNNLEEYRHTLEKYNLGNLNDIESIWEDIIYFNFNDVSGERFFTHYHDLTDNKHRLDYGMGSGVRFGDQEGFTILLSAKLSNIPLQINESLKDIAKNLRAINYTYDNQVILPILSEMDIVIPYRKDSEERKRNLEITLNYYKKHFENSNFIISEQGAQQTVQIKNFDYLFRRKELPHNQSLCINDGVRFSKKKYVCVIDCDIILLNFYNIYLSIKDMILGDVEYSLPYTECFDLPNFDLRQPWGDKCVGGIFVIDREKFIELGMNDERFLGWGREDDERHQRLLRNGIKFKRYHGEIIHLYHPIQSNITISAENNLNLLNQLIK